MDYEQIESSQRQHNEVLRHQEAMIEACTGSEFKLFAMLKPTLLQDGDEWCCLLGDNLQVGIVGYGKTPYKAVMAWNAAWHEDAKFCMPDGINSKEEHEQYLKDIGVK